MGRRGRRRGPGGRAEERVRGRVRENTRGRTGRGERSSGGKRGPGSFDVGAIEDYANRLKSSTGSRSQFPGSASGFPPGAASGLAGAASGLAGGSLAQRFLGEGSGDSEEEFRREVMEHLALLDERVQRLEDQLQTAGEGGDAADLAETGEGQDPESGS